MAGPSLGAKQRAQCPLEKTHRYTVPEYPSPLRRNTDYMEVRVVAQTIGDLLRGFEKRSLVIPVKF